MQKAKIIISKKKESGRTFKDIILSEMSVSEKDTHWMIDSTSPKHLEQSDSQKQREERGLPGAMGRRKWGVVS